MGLSTDASSSPGVIFQDFDSLRGIGKSLPFSAEQQVSV